MKLVAAVSPVDDIAYSGLRTFRIALRKQQAVAMQDCVAKCLCCVRHDMPLCLSDPHGGG
jgi:hypothetical protein